MNQDQGRVFNVIADALWRAHVARQSDPASWATWSEVSKLRGSIPRECREDASLVEDALISAGLLRVYGRRRPVVDRTEGEAGVSGEGTTRWDRHFIEMAVLCAGMSKDPRTRVGAVIIGPDREVRSTGFNGFPRGISDTYERLHDKTEKLRLVVHAEVNAILNAARVGIPDRKSVV